MKTINYTGNSKLITRIVHLLNRKAPLPLDGQGDAEWGTSGQVLTTDGQGNTSWTDKGGGGGGSTVSYTQTLASGTKTGEIEIDGVSTNMYAPTPPTKTSDLTNDSGFITSADVPTKTSDLTNDSGFITNLVNNLANYYTKSQTYTQAEVDALISGIVTLNILVVQALPTQDISTTTIYLVPKQDTGTSDIYDEYLYINNAWELIGTTQIDLSNYVTTTDLSTALADYVTSVGLATILAGYVQSSDLGDGTLTIQQNGTTLGTFTANQSGNATANITVPTKTSELTNDSGFLTSSNIWLAYGTPFYYGNRSNSTLRFTFTNLSVNESIHLLIFGRYGAQFVMLHPNNVGFNDNAEVFRMYGTAMRVTVHTDSFMVDIGVGAWSAVYGMYVHPHYPNSTLTITQL